MAVKEEQKKCEIVGSKLTFRNSESGFAIFRVKTEIGTGTACGVIPETVGPGDIITLTGKWEVNPKFGKQFKFSSIEVEPPCTDDPEGVRRLLMKLPGIGKVKAERAIEEHGHDKAWELALTSPDQLGMPMSRSDEIRAAAASLLSSYDDQVYFLGLGLSAGQINKVTSEFGTGPEGGMKVVKETPYRMLEIGGFGFKTVDSIALRAGVSIKAEGRIAACVLFFLNETKESAGHTWFYMSVLINGQDRAGGIDGVLKLLKSSAMDNNCQLSELPGEEDIERVVRNLAREGRVVIEEGRVYDAGLMKAEKGILGALGL